MAPPEECGQCEVASISENVEGGGRREERAENRKETGGRESRLPLDVKYFVL